MANISEELQHVAPTPATKTYMELINDCDNFPYPDTDPKSYTSHISTYYHLFIPPCPSPLGYLLPSVALTLQGIAGWTIDETTRTLTLDLPDLSPPRAPTDPQPTTLFSVFSSGLAGAPSPKQPLDSSAPTADSAASSAEPGPAAYETARTAILARTTAAMRSLDHFAVLRKWRDELYPIYFRDPHTQQPTLLASVERAASSLFGIVTYGAHMTAYVREAEGEMKIWVARRAVSKGTYPGLLDDTVAGGISTGESPFETMVREAREEADLPEELVKRKAVSTGTVTDFHIRDERAGGETRLLQPECEFVFDLDLTGENVTPKSGDPEEVEGFELMSIEELKGALGRGEFKPNCALVKLDFLVRHGVITRENESDYCEIVTRLHRRLEFPVL